MAVRSLRSLPILAFSLGVLIAGFACQTVEGSPIVDDEDDASRAGIDATAIDAADAADAAVTADAADAADSADAADAADAADSADDGG